MIQWRDIGDVLISGRGYAIERRTVYSTSGGASMDLAKLYVPTPSGDLVFWKSWREDEVTDPIERCKREARAHLSRQERRRAGKFRIVGQRLGSVEIRLDRLENPE